jgi:hypothetical protein
MEAKRMTESERLKRMLEQDRDWMWDEGFYTVANRLDRVLEYINKLEQLNDA